MESGQSLALDLGVAVSSRATVGLRFSFGILGTKFQQIGPLNAATSDNDWTRYVGGLFGEYRLTEWRAAPFVGTSLGVQGVHVSYVETFDGFNGQGDFGFGFGLFTGLQYRSSQRFGVMIRFDAENAPSLTDGWFYQAQLGLRLFV